MISAIHQALGSDFDRLPAAVRRFHDNNGFLATKGLADAEIASGLPARLICALVGFPRHGKGQDVIVSFATDAEGVDSWRRDFSARRYRSTLRASGTPGGLIERQGPFTNTFHLSASPDRLMLTVTRFALFGIRLPAVLSPRCDAVETDYNGALHFDIAISMPLIGPLITYRGTLHALASDA